MDAAVGVPTGERLRFGEYLVASGAITSEQLQSALDLQESARLKGAPHRRLGEILHDRGMLHPNHLALHLANWAGETYWDLTLNPPDPSALEGSGITIGDCRRLGVIPIRKDEGVVTVGNVDPTNTAARETLDRVFPGMWREVVVDVTAHAIALERAAGAGFKILIGSAALESDAAAFNAGVPEQVLGRLIDQALVLRASDIHIEPDTDRYSIVRFRIDGKLQRVGEPLPIVLGMQLAAYVKNAAQMKSVETRLPQDGRLTIGGTELRVSTLPCAGGEKVVMRVSQSEQRGWELHQLLPSEQYGLLHHALQMRQGLILVTGPTGSGKTTTLYASLEEMRDPSRSFVSIENPIERRIGFVTQTEIRADIGLDYTAILPAVLRQDPDVLLVGEIRDAATAHAVVSLAESGHLVLSTLHTNDAVSAVSRMIGFGVNRHLLGQVLRLVLAQRLVRRLCGSCRRDAYRPTWAEAEFGIVLPAEGTWMYPDGCPSCRGTGYGTRLGLYEALHIDDAASYVVSHGGDEQELLAAVPHHHDLWHAGITAAATGATSIEEIVGHLAGIRSYARTGQTQ